VHDAPGLTVLKIIGTDLSGFYNEAGGHRIQRIPPTERKGRTHTSTVTVAVLNAPPSTSGIDLSESNLKIEWYSGSGSGGQHRNKHQNSVRLTHLPSNITVTSQTRSRKNSLNEAMAELKRRLDHIEKSTRYHETNSIRKGQVGSGQRGDKVRTIQFQHNSAVDHRTGKRCTAEQYVKGEMNLLWPNTK
jgi:peptide chain release factor 1